MKEKREHRPTDSIHSLNSPCVAILTRWPSAIKGLARAIYGCTSPRDPIVKKVKCNDTLGLNVKNVDEADVYIMAGSESVMPSGAGLGSESVLPEVFASNSSRSRASRFPGLSTGASLAAAGR